MKTIGALGGIVCIGFMMSVNFSFAQVPDTSGVAGAVRPQASGTLVGRGTEILQIGAEVFKDEHIRTDNNGRAALIFLDGTQFLVGPDSNVVINQYRYDPASRLGQLAATVGSGEYRVTAGMLIGQSPAIIIRLLGVSGRPAGQIEVENRTSDRSSRAIVAVQVAGVGESVIANLGGGSTTVRGAGGESVQITRTGFYTRIAPGGAPTSPRPVPPGMVEGMQGRMEGRGGTGQIASERTAAAISRQNSSLPLGALLPGRLEGSLNNLDPGRIDALAGIDPTRLGTVRQHAFTAGPITPLPPPTPSLPAEFWADRLARCAARGC